MTDLSIPSSVHPFAQVGRDTHPGVFELHSPDWRYAYVNMAHFVGGKRQADEIDKVMRSIIKNKPDHVILDLTENPGGRIDQASRLLSYFLNTSHQVAKNVYRRSRKVQVDKSFAAFSPERMKDHKSSLKQFRKVRRKRGRYTLRVRRRSFGHPSYKGKVTVLVSPLTHSAATIVALILKQKRKATIVGYQNGGSTRTSCFAPNGTYTLPISNIKVRIAETCFQRNRIKGDKTGRLVPDVEIDPHDHRSDRLLGTIIKAGVQHVLSNSESAENASQRP